MAAPIILLIVLDEKATIWYSLRQLFSRATHYDLHASDVREIMFSPKIGRREQDFLVSNMLSEKYGKLMRV